MKVGEKEFLQYFCDMTNYELAKAIGECLKENGKTLSAAESCTGGNISHQITLVPGSSAYYLGSVTSYAVKVKETVLHVPSEIIEKYGVVSAETACAMAKGVRELTDSDYAVSTTGLAGPGGDGVYPEGTVYIGLCKRGEEPVAAIYNSPASLRSDHIDNFTHEALQRLLELIPKKDY